MKKYIIITLTIFSIVACSKTKNVVSKNGGQDSGGGGGKGTSELVIRKILDDKKRLEAEILEIFSNLDSNVPFENKEFAQQWKTRVNESKLDVSKVLENITLEKTCIDKHKEEKSATVEIENVDSPVCLSLNLLTQIPSESIKKQIISLLMHEISHLIGYYEYNAQRMQDLINAYYDNLLISQNINSKINIAYKLSRSNALDKISDLKYKSKDRKFIDSREFKEGIYILSDIMLPNLSTISEAQYLALETRSYHDPDLNLETEQLSIMHAKKALHSINKIKTILGQNNPLNPSDYNEIKRLMILSELYLSDSKMVHPSDADLL